MTDPSSVPLDAGLPQLPALLDAERMGAVLGRSLSTGLPDGAVRIRYLRYRPGKSVVVGYDVFVAEAAHEVFAWAATGAELASRAAGPEARGLAAKLNGRTPTTAPLEYERELDALVQWLPLDVALPAMAEPPARLRDRLAAAGLELDDGDLPRVVKHKPMTRGVLRFDRHIAKVYPDEDAFAAAVDALDRSASLPFPTAQRTAVVPELLLTTQSLLPGRRPEGDAATTGRVGELLAVLHATPREGLAEEPPAHDLRRARRQAKLLATIVPALAPRLDALMRRLESELPDDELVASHGGFHLSQLLEADGELGVVDFDGMCLAAPARDLASYVASLVAQPEDVQRAAETLDRLIAAYGRRPPGLSWYLATRVLGRARRPFARFVDGWPAKVEERVAAAEAALQLR